MTTCLNPIAVMILFSSLAWGAEIKPKYGPEAIPLSISHEYFRQHSTSPFWKYIPYYLPQQTESSCSVASVAMLVNAARVGMKFTAEDELVTEAGLLKKLHESTWSRKTGLLGRGVSLSELGPLIQESLKAYGIHPIQVEVVHTPDLSESTRKKLHESLVKAETSKNEYLVINFIQGIYTGDADVGHIAPLAAYDSEHKKVLVLDPDRKWYEPYWVSEDTLLKGMVTRDKGSNQNRGYVRISLPERQ